MNNMRWVGIGIYLVCVFCLLVVLLSGFSNLSRIVSGWLEGEASSSAHHGSCGYLDECLVNPIDGSNKKDLVVGAQIYFNYCLTCHSLEHSRYERIAADLEIPEEIMKANMLFAPGQLSQLIKTGIDPKDAAEWFGVAPPDLSLITRAKGEDYIYTYLMSFYSDSSTGTGYNNLAFPNVAMPHVLERMQGQRSKGCANLPSIAPNGGVKRDLVTGEDILEEQCGVLIKSDRYEDQELSDEEFASAMGSVTAFLAYTAEPYKEDRLSLGFYVIMFLIVFTMFAWLLEEEYKKDYPRRSKK